MIYLPILIFMEAIMNQTLVIGSTALDIIMNVPHLPVTGEDIHVLSQTMSLGGCAYNASDVLRLFQVPYTLCSPVGEGMYGNYVREKLLEKGVTAPIHVSDMDNGCCYCMVEESGERTFVSYHGIEYTFQKEWLNHMDISTVDSVYICGLEIEEVDGNEIISFLEEHKEYTIYFATGPRITHIEQEKMQRLFALSPILHMNKEEALLYTECDTIMDAAQFFYNKTKNTVIITCGEDGAYLYEDGTGAYIAAVLTEVVDTIGAGDSHIGAIMACVHLGKSLKEAIVTANKVSAAVVSVKGATLSDELFVAINLE